VARIGYFGGFKAREFNMRKFAYRTPRYAVDLPVCFEVQDSSIPGRCLEIGGGGVRVELEQHVPPGTCGTLSIRYKDIAIDLSVRVAHSGSDFDGLKFHLESNADQSAVERLIAYFSDPNGQKGPALVD
jgi:hypothetical protein